MGLMQMVRWLNVNGAVDGSRLASTQWLELPQRSRFPSIRRSTDSRDRRLDRRLEATFQSRAIAQRGKA